MVNSLHASCLGFKLYNGNVLKPFQNKNRGECEYAFYEHLKALALSPQKSMHQMKMQQFFPKYFGDMTLKVSEKESRSEFFNA